MMSNALHVESPFPSALPNIRIEGNSIHTRHSAKETTLSCRESIQLSHTTNLGLLMSHAT